MISVEVESNLTSTGGYEEDSLLIRCVSRVKVPVEPTILEYSFLDQFVAFQSAHGAGKDLSGFIEGTGFDSLRLCSQPIDRFDNVLPDQLRNCLRILGFADKNGDPLAHHV